MAGLLVPVAPAVAGISAPPPKQCKQKQCPPKAEKPKCNAGRGNGSELVRVGGRLVDCDPGNSGGRNQGGD